MELVWSIYESRESLPYEEMTIRDMVGKLVKYGSMSEKQLAFMRSLAARIPQRATIEAKRAAETEAAAPCPTGRITVSGEVLSVRVDESDYGPVTKMLVKANEGYKVWASMPAHANANRGDKIVFAVNLTPSGTDPKFGFGKRPKLVSIEYAIDAATA